MKRGEIAGDIIEIELCYFILFYLMQYYLI